MKSILIAFFLVTTALLCGCTSTGGNSPSNSTGDGGFLAPAPSSPVDYTDTMRRGYRDEFR